MYLNGIDFSKIQNLLNEDRRNQTNHAYPLFQRSYKDRQFTHKRVSNARSVLNGIMSYAIEEEIYIT